MCRVILAPCDRSLKLTLLTLYTPVKTYVELVNSILAINSKTIIFIAIVVPARDILACLGKVAVK